MHKGLLILLLGLTVLLSACGTSSEKNINDNLYTLSGKVLGYTGGDADVEALWNEDSYGAGHIKADGTFSITLENPLADSRLASLESEFNPEDFCSSLKVSSSSKGTVLPVLTITKNGNVLGRIGQVSSLDMVSDLNETNYTTLNAGGIGRVYANQNTVISGMCQDNLVSIDLDLNQGWNAVYISVDGKGQANVASSGDNLSWYYLAQE